MGSKSRADPEWLRRAQVGRGGTGVPGGSIHRGLECRWNMSFKNCDQSGSFFFIIKKYIYVHTHTHNDSLSVPKPSLTVHCPKIITVYILLSFLVTILSGHF